MQNMKKAAVVAVLTGGLAIAAGGAAFADGVGSGADGAATGSPGAVSGNTIQVPVFVPVSVCNNTIDVIGSLNPAFGQPCGGN